MYRGEKVISSLRASRVAGQIKKEISNIIADEIKDPRVKPAVTTVTDVQVSRDLGHAWFISVFLRTMRKTGKLFWKLWRGRRDLFVYR